MQQNRQNLTGKEERGDTGTLPMGPTALCEHCSSSGSNNPIGALLWSLGNIQASKKNPCFHCDQIFALINKL